MPKANRQIFIYYSLFSRMKAEKLSRRGVMIDKWLSLRRHIVLMPLKTNAPKHNYVFASRPASNHLQCIIIWPRVSWLIFELINEKILFIWQWRYRALRLMDMSCPRSHHYFRHRQREAEISLYFGENYDDRATLRPINRMTWWRPARQQ